MKKIAIVGSAGSGKSTFARKLGDITNISVYHLDSLFWKPNWISITTEELKEIQSELVKESEWIFDGNYSSTMDIRLEAADTIIFLDIPKTTCVYRAITRTIRYRNKVRPDMGHGCKEKLDLSFLRWIWSFSSVERPRILDKLHNLSKDKNIYILSSTKEVESFLCSIKIIREKNSEIYCNH